jgi:hypothetical protein
MLLIFPIFLILGLFLPGYCIARALRHKLPWASAFPLSLLVLFHVIFWPGVFGLPLTLWTVLPILLAVTGGAAWLARRSAASSKTEPAPPWDKLDRVLLVSSGLVGLVLLARSLISPLIGFDTRFRWDFLAQRMLALGRFDFYPPLSPADFRTYFFVDGIPPLVSFTHWWLYASAGQYLPTLIAIFVTAQFACALVFTYGAASALYSRRAGILAAATLAACPLFFKAVVLGQETGLTALAIAAMLYFIVSAQEESDVPAMVSAGLAAALCALSREYGWIALISGAIALLWRRRPLKQILIFAAVAASVAAPWYIRNWARTGNPFYSLSFAGFPVNPVHVAILKLYNDLLGFSRWNGDTWASLLSFVLIFATLQFVAGIPGGFTHFRRNGYLIVIAFLLTAVWVQSVGYTSGGISISTRVLSPMMVVLSVTAAALLARITRRGAVVGVIIAFQIWTALHGVLYPNNPSALKLSEWSQNIFRPVKEDAEFQLADQFSKYLPAGARVLSDSAHLHAALIDKGVEVVPVWSPEVSFLFTASPEESERRLRDLHIVNVGYYPRSLNTRYLVSASPFYAALPQRWRIQAQIPGTLYLLTPKTP